MVTDSHEPDGIHIREVRGVTVVRVRGAISLLTAALFHDALHTAAHLGRPVIVNLTAVTYLDPTGLREIEHVKRVATRQPVALVASDARISPLVPIGGLAQAWPMFRTEDAALAYLHACCRVETGGDA